MAKHGWDTILTFELREVRLTEIDPIEVDPRQQSIGSVVTQAMRERCVPTSHPNDQQQQKQQANSQSQQHVSVAEVAAQFVGPRTDLHAGDTGRSMLASLENTHGGLCSTRRETASSRLLHFCERSTV